MEFLWLWAYSLKTPLSIICGVALLGCFLSWLSARSQRKDQNFATLHIGIVIGLTWTAIYAIPAPDYNVRTVIKEVPKPYPVVRTIKYVAQKQVLTRTITQTSTQDQKYNECMAEKSHPYSDDEMTDCFNFARRYVQPKIVVQQVKVPVPSGIQVKIEHDSYAKLFDQCNATGAINSGNDGGHGAEVRNERIKACTDYALKGSHDH